jgi:hypothetical protein
LSGPSVSLPSFSFIPHLEAGYLLRKKMRTLTFMYGDKKHAQCCLAIDTVSSLQGVVI